MKKIYLALPVLLLTSLLSACSSSDGDTVKPSVALPAVSDVVQPGSVTYTATASDDRGIKEVDFYLDGSSTPLVQDTTAPYEVAINWTAAQNGTHTLRAVAVDTSGNTSETVQTFKVNIVADTVKPTVNLPAISDVVQPSSVTYTATASDDRGIKEVDFYLDGSATPLVQDTTAPYQVVINWTAAQNGTHTLRAVAVDTSGNTSESVQTFKVNIVTDTVAPTVSITTDAPNPITVAGTYNLNVTASDNIGVTKMHGLLTRTDAAGKVTTLIDNDTPTTTYSLPVTVDSNLNGTYNLTITATDAAGNTTTKTASITVAIPTTTTPPTPTPGDTTPPSLSIVVPSGTITQAGDYDVTVNVSDNVGVTSITGTATNSALGISIPLTLSTRGGTTSVPVNKTFNGTTTISITACDAAGNCTTKSASIVVNIP